MGTLCHRSALPHSRGSFTFHFVRYEDATPQAQEKAIVEQPKAMAEEAE